MGNKQKYSEKINRNKRKLGRRLLERKKSHSIGQKHVETEANVNREELNATTHDISNENVIPTNHIGRRIVNISHFFQELQQICYGPLQCGLESIEIISEVRDGLITNIVLQCKMCNKMFKTSTDNTSDNNMDVNIYAVAGTVAIGNGYTQLAELFATLDIPIMGSHLFNKQMNFLNTVWEQEALKSMAEAEEGRVSAEGIPIIDVIADGCWGERSYKKNYSSLSGAAAIVGKHSNKFLFLGIKNKYCLICAQAEHKGMAVKDHTCFKNYTGNKHRRLFHWSVGSTAPPMILAHNYQQITLIS